MLNKRSGGDNKGSAIGSSRTICHYFNTSKGCARGDTCRFVHEQRLTLTAAQEICRFYVQGFCKRGDSCRYVHALETTEASSNAETSLDTLRLSGTSAASSVETKVNGKGKQVLKSMCMPPDTEPNRSSSNSLKDNPSSSSKLEISESAPDDEAHVCSICFEAPKQFGLLVGCDHVFCLSCVREWRNSKNKSLELRESAVIKDCPVCRATSDYIVPSFHYAKGRPKEKLIENYKKRLSEIPCKYFNRSGRWMHVCPFQESCFYSHNDEDGNRLPCKHPPRQRLHSHALHIIHRELEQYAHAILTGRPPSGYFDDDFYDDVDDFYDEDDEVSTDDFYSENDDEWETDEDFDTEEEDIYYHSDDDNSDWHCHCQCSCQHDSDLGEEVG